LGGTGVFFAGAAAVFRGAGAGFRAAALALAGFFAGLFFFGDGFFFIRVLKTSRVRFVGRQIEVGAAWIPTCLLWR
jgi:hypothetical protein